MSVKIRSSETLRATCHHVKRRFVFNRWCQFPITREQATPKLIFQTKRCDRYFALGFLDAAGLALLPLLPLPSFNATAARTNACNAASLIASPS